MKISGAEHELIGGDGPLVALVALVLAMALLAPTVAPERVVTRPGVAADNRRSKLADRASPERRVGGEPAPVPAGGAEGRQR